MSPPMTNTARVSGDHQVCGVIRQYGPDQFSLPTHFAPPSNDLALSGNHQHEPSRINSPYSIW